MNSTSHILLFNLQPIVRATVRMILTSALCFVLVVSSSWADQANVRQLSVDILSKIVDSIVNAAHSGRQLDPQELNSHILNRLNNDLKQLGPRLNQIFAQAVQDGETVESKARALTLEINQNKAVNDALARNNRYQPRFVGALVLGITQIITDVVKMGLTRY